MIQFLAENWVLLVVAVAVIAVAAYSVYSFIKISRGEKISKVQEWLLWAVAEAEKALGGGTGQLKLRYVYDLFVTKFPIVAKFLTFDRFSIMVDIALEKFNKILSSNTKVQEYILPENEQE